LKEWEFTSIEKARDHCTRHAKNKGFSFPMGCVTKSRANGIKIGQEFLCSKEGFRPKKYEKKIVDLPYIMKRG
jgi:hypothetical protein